LLRESAVRQCERFMEECPRMRATKHSSVHPERTAAGAAGA
jgi:hypothetical protein